MKKSNLLFANFSVVMTLIIAFVSLSFTFGPESFLIKDEFACTPCGQACDKEVHSAPGTCSHCNMPLVKKSSINFKTIQPSEVCNYISQNPKVIILDVRTNAEFEGRAEPNLGRLKNAINLPIQELEAKIATLAAYKDREIIVYCSLSRRSPRASYILSQNGFKKVYNMAGGMSVFMDNSCKVK